MVIEADSKAKRAHLLFVVIEDHEVTIDTIIFGDEMEKGHSDVAESVEVLALHLTIE